MFNTVRNLRIMNVCWWICIEFIVRINNASACISFVFCVLLYYSVLYSLCLCRNNNIDIYHLEDEHTPRYYTVRTKPANRFPVTSTTMIIAITKRKKLSETKVVKWMTELSRSQLAKSTLISIYELWRKELWDYRFCKHTKWRPEIGAFRVKYG